MMIDPYQAAVVIFVAGGFYFTTRASFKEQTKSVEDVKREHTKNVDGLGAELRREISDLRAELAKDMSGIGTKVKSIDDRENRRYHNVSLAIVLASPPKSEDKISILLKE